MKPAAGSLSRPPSPPLTLASQSYTNPHAVVRAHHLDELFAQHTASLMDRVQGMVVHNSQLQLQAYDHRLQQLLHTFFDHIEQGEENSQRIAESFNQALRATVHDIDNQLIVNHVHREDIEDQVQLTIEAIIRHVNNPALHQEGGQVNPEIIVEDGRVIHPVAAHVGAAQLNINIPNEPVGQAQASRRLCLRNVTCLTFSALCFTGGAILLAMGIRQALSDSVDGGGNSTTPAPFTNLTEGFLFP